ncbi:MAG: SDR family oxidoreductase [bacterium]|nr:SDR family oxidoreductase [bacterium]
MKLKDKIAIVTGGAQGIGAAIARKFVNEGALVLVGDSNKEGGLAAVLAMQEEVGRFVFFQHLDVTDSLSIATFVKVALALFGHIDILVNNAGIVKDNLLVNMSDEDFDAVINVNLRGVERMTRAVVPTMIAQKSGVILNASSLVASGNIGQTNYAASKAGVESMTVTWAGEFGKYGIRVNAIAPGITDTTMVAGIPDKVKEYYVKRTPLGRYARPEEIAAAYAFLASEEASFITGAIIPVNGGLRI